MNQKGFAHLLVIGTMVALAAGLGVGVYLAQQRTNISPQAEELVQPERNITGIGAAPDLQIPGVAIPEWMLALIPTQAPTPMSDAVSPTPTSAPTPTVATPTVTPAPTSSPTPTLSPTPTSTTSPSATPQPTQTGATPTSAITPTTSHLSPTSISMEGRYRVSFDSNFATLIDTGDGGVFGSGNDKTINITLPGGSGPKHVYIQFYENGAWIPSIPILASIDVQVNSGPAPTPN